MTKPTSNKPTFVCVTYINTTAEKVWRALTEGEFTRRYWGNHRNASDWRVGSDWRHEDFDDPGIVDIVGKVLEADRPRRLVLSWADPSEAKNPAKVSRVTFEIAADGGMVRLTVAHDELEPGSGMAQGVSEGWPMVVSSLKTLLETGEPMPPTWAREGKGWKRLRFANPLTTAAAAMHRYHRDRRGTLAGAVVSSRSASPRTPESLLSRHPAPGP
jgi:uncharacterized protein YndB with AHSA1/START domain